MKTELVNNDQKLEILVEGERYRVCNICTFIGINEENTMLIKHNPLSYGLAVEQKTDTNHYYVVCFIKWDSKENKPYIDDVDGRSLSTLSDLLDEVIDPYQIVFYLNEYFNCIDFAKQALIDINSKEEE